MNDNGHRDRTVHMIANAHIDPAWLWQWREGREEVLATCRSALDLMDEFPELTFSRGGAATYEWIQQADPDMFERIRRRVEEGRWEIVNGWWVQPDCNLPCGESFIRHCLYGKRYFREKFGVDVTVGYNVDSFGHCSVLPQVLRKAGFNYYVFFRPGPHEKELPGGIFWWESSDGSRVLALRAPHHYNCSAQEDMVRRIHDACAMSDPQARNVACFYGLGNHGGGPTREHIRQILGARDASDAPAVKFSTLAGYFKAVLQEGREFPVVKEDLQHHAVGCYTAVSEIKRQNRSAETLLMTTERFATAASALNLAAGQQPTLTAAWKRVLFNQFHDILAGSSIRPVYDDADFDYAAVHRDASDALNRALDAFSRNLNTAGNGQAVVVFNPLPWDRKDVVVTDFLLPDFATPFKLVDSSGRNVPVQVISEVDHAGRCRATVCFVVAMPALGCSVLHVIAGESEDSPGSLRAREATIESSRYRLVIAPDTGHVLSLRHKPSGVECLAGPGCVPVVLNDTSDTWSHDVSEYKDETGHFCGPARVIESGPVRTVVRASQAWGRSTIEHDFIVYDDLDRIDCVMNINWREQHKMLKLTLPVDVADPRARYEVPLDTIQRGTSGTEEPGQRWVDISGLGPNGTPFGVALINDSKYGYDATGNVLRMSVLRSPIYAFHDPRKVERHKRYLFTDQGPQTVRYSLLPHAGDWRDAGVMHAGYALNNPGFAIEAPSHPGRLGTSISLARTAPRNVLIEVIKQAEDGNGIIVRLYETHGRDTQATLELPLLGVSHAFPIGHNEIKTFRITGTSVTETNLLED